jgi:hypothetical protein
MARESGVEYNPETASYLRPRDFSFSGYGVVFRFTLQIPEYITIRLDDSGAKDKLHDHMNAHCCAVVETALKGGYVHTDQGEAAMRADVGKHLKNYIWERFSISQETAGESCWQTAPTLQRVHNV